MKSLNVKIGDKSVILHLPEKIEEIDINYLKAVTKNVVIEENYALVALCISDKLSTLINTKQREITVKGITILVDLNDPKNILKSKPGDILICSNTDIMRGYEVTSIKNVLSPSKVSSLVKLDTELTKTLFTTNTENIWLVTFKLVPLNNIHGSYIDCTLTEEEKNVISNYYKCD